MWFVIISHPFVAGFRWNVDEKGPMGLANIFSI